MKAIYTLGLMLMWSLAVYGQQSGTALNVVNPNEPQPDPTGQRLQVLLKNAYEAEQAGNMQQATAYRQQADQERQSLLRRIDALQAEIEQIRQATGAGTQVMVKIQVFEVSLTKLRKLGFDWSNSSGDLATKSNLDQTFAKEQSFTVFKDCDAFLQVLESLRKDNLVKVLAEPKLVTESGRSAVMQVGNEFSVPKLQPDGTTSIERQHSTEVEVLPLVSDDKIKMEVRIRLAEPDYDHTVQVGKETIPGIRSRECNTAAMFKSGQPVLLGGLISTREESENVGMPVLSEIPYAGVPFRKVKTTRNDVEMFIVVRPEILQSSPAADSPTADLRNAPKPNTKRY